MTFLEKVVMVIGILVFMLITGVAKANPVEQVTNWLSKEWVKTVEFQKESWAQAKEQNQKNKLYIQDLFKKVKENVSQN
jgi:competence protein ComGC